MIVAGYLSAIVVANLLAATYGPAVTVPVAFVFVGFDLVARDRLHDRWTSHRWPKMLALIAVGGALSFLVNGAAGPIAVASTVAFAAASLADTLVYAALEDRGWMTRANGSNVAASAVDSILFPTLAFGAFLPIVVLGQFVAKVGGGALWSLVLRR